MSPDDLLDFWFGDQPVDTADAFRERASLWFSPNPANDAMIRERHGELIERVFRGELDGWGTSPRGRLAMILAVDQLPRNAFRGTARAFAYDARALALSEGGIDHGLDRELTTIERIFFNMPRGHAEDVRRQKIANAYVDELFLREPALAPLVVPHARQHLAVIERFGRFPERNAALGRVSTDEERAYLETGRLP